ncbi:MAG TPA: CO dehydrogenase/acetyl-CoA synthase complex subunit epsilon [Candidatus Altiarchaeales archaeon]|nr:CO dehydrogenase/acetyl-CoA synthase complex subunit epsilon [Candidatus Altiarchaeales archaeon]
MNIKMNIKKENVRIYIGRITEEDDWDEPVGPNLKPQPTDLRDWDWILLNRYKPKYHAYITQCQFCAYGPCDLSKGRRGSCGITLEKQMAREGLFLAITGAAAHTAHGRHLVERLVEKFGRNARINAAENSEVQAPWMHLVLGKRPKTIGDLEEGLEYVEEQLTHLLSALHAGQESSDIDFNSKALHAGMIDHLGMEISDIAQISLLGFPRGDPEPNMVEIGFGCIDKAKPVILCIGHNVCAGSVIVDYVNDNNLDIEIAGICCTSLDLGRYSSSKENNIKRNTKIVGQLSYQLPFVRSGISDVIVLDEQCIRVDTLDNARKLGIPVITTSDKNCSGLPNLENEDPEIIVKKLVNREIPGCYIPDLDKVGKIAAKTAIEIRKNKQKKRGDALDNLKECITCGLCKNACPVGLDVTKIVASINLHFNEIKPKPRGKEGKVQETFETKEELLDEIGKCVFCGRCESWCPKKIEIVSGYSEVYKDRFANDKAKISPGRGPIQDVEVREVGSPIVFGEIPGVLAPVGCSLWPHGGKELGEIVEEFLKRRWIVTTSGCSAMALATDYSGTHNLYEKYGGQFDAGCLVNVGSCVANSHITGVAIKVAKIFARRPLRANFEEIADYLLNRLGAVGLVWGTYSQKAVSIGNGVMRLGIPVIWSPSGKKYRKELLSTEDTDWTVYDTRSDGKYNVGPVPEHLSYVAETKEDVMVMIPKLCMRASDGVKGRQIKLAHYIDVSEKYLGKMPDDLYKFVRTEKDLPMERKDELMKILKDQNWKPVDKVPDPTLLSRLSGGSKQ